MKSSLLARRLRAAHPHNQKLGSRDLSLFSFFFSILFSNFLYIQNYVKTNMKNFVIMSVNVNTVLDIFISKYIINLYKNDRYISGHSGIFYLGI